MTVITETWLHDEIPDSDVVPPSYSIHRRDRPSRGGGVAVVVRHNVTAIPLEQIDDHESLCLRITCDGSSFIVIAVYRAPSADACFLTKLYDYATKHSKSTIIIAGDLNLPNINWPSLSSSSSGDHAIFDIMLACNLNQAVNIPTRVQGTSSSVLDLVLYSATLSEVRVEVVDGFSDHKVVIFTCCLGGRLASVSERKTVKDFSKANDESVLDFLDSELDNFTDNDVNFLWDKFQAICHFCIDSFIPVKTKNVRRSNPWINRDIIHLVRKIKRLKKRKVNNTLFKTLSQTLADKISASKQFFYSTTLTNFIKTNPSKFWRHLNASGSHEINSIKIGNEIITDKQAIATEFNCFFQSVYSDSLPRHKIGEIRNPTEVNPDFISYEGIVSMLLHLKLKSSTGPDKIPNIFLYRYAESIAKFLIIIFRLSFSGGVVPSKWRIARIVPIFKAGDRAVHTNYRPISLLNTCCKLLEHIISNYLTEFLNYHNILTPFQHGFRKGLSTTTQLVSIVHTFSSVIDKSGQVDAIFLDLSKAFDRVSHSGLLYKLNQLNVPCTLIKWIASYLEVRKQFVDIGGQVSDLGSVNSGVPQGSVLGPLLFLVYINDITSCVHESVGIRLFADDCLLYRAVESTDDQTTLNNSLNAISNWCDKWGMKLNETKTVFMRITNKKFPLLYDYSINGSQIAHTNSFKYLGVTFTNNLTWSTHIDTICASARRKLGLLRHKLKKSPPDVKLLAYNTLIRPRLEYACIVWDPHTKNDINKLEQIQRLAVRFIYNRYRRHDSPTCLMKTNNIMTLQNRRKITRLKFLYQLWNRKLSLDPLPYLQLLPHRPTRNYHPLKFTPIFARTNNFKFSFFPRTINDWNVLPPEIFLSNNVPQLIDQLFE